MTEGRPLSVFSAADEHPSRVALVVGGSEIRWCELADRVERVTSWLDRQRPGSATGDDHQGGAVALVPRLDLETVCLLLALVERGVPAVLIHPRLTPPERAGLIADASPSVVIDDVARSLSPGAWAKRPGAGRPSGRPVVDDRRCLAILYTSGTTGRPKGAILSRGAFVAAADASADNLGWRPEERWLLAMPLAHVGGLSILLRALIARRTVVIPESERFDPELVRDVIVRDRVTIASFVPTMLQRLLDVSPALPLPAHLRAVLLGGAATPARLLEEARGRGVPVLTTYGLTEACSQVTTQRYGTAPGIEQGSGPPVRGAEIRIVDDRVEVRGPSLMSGYHGLASEDSPLRPDGWFRTEDFGRIDAEGRLHLLGRCQEMLVTGGENVFPLEVERTLEAIPGIDAACVFGTPDETWGEIVSAALVLRPGAVHSLAALAAAVATVLAPHKRPRQVALVGELPMTPAGKLDRRAAAEAAIPRLVTFRTA